MTVDENNNAIVLFCLW